MEKAEIMFEQRRGNSSLRKFEGGCNELCLFMKAKEWFNGQIRQF
jgi:hypothetical protein